MHIKQVTLTPGEIWLAWIAFRNIQADISDDNIDLLIEVTQTFRRHIEFDKLVNSTERNAGLITKEASEIKLSIAAFHFFCERVLDFKSWVRIGLIERIEEVNNLRIKLKQARLSKEIIKEPKAAP